MKNQGYTFGKYYREAILHPSRSFSALINDQRALRFAFGAASIPAILYTFVYVFLIMGGGLPYKPWLNIAPEQYYRYNVFFCAPSMFLGWLLSASVMHLLARIFSEERSMEKLLAATAFGLSISMWTTGIHDLVSSFLGAVHIIDQNGYEEALNSPTVWRTLLWIQMSLYLVLFVVYFSFGVKTIYKTKPWTSVLIGLSGFLVFQGFFLIFNR